jgi:pimeloyl-ACP methyl ester carboxylesterase
MLPVEQTASHAVTANDRVTRLFQRRSEIAREQWTSRVGKITEKMAALQAGALSSPWRLWEESWAYGVDAWQRSVLFMNTLHERGNNYLRHVAAGQPPVLHFDYETVLDARTFERPVNYALIRITPPAGVVVDPKKRPYVIIDPRAGHGPGIGGFKDDSQVGVALRGGHPVYFVMFFREPEPGQTLLDVCSVEAVFVRKVRELHPDSPKPAIIGNCQGGWAAMMLAASGPEDTGPIVINGAPMSYWGGSWGDGVVDNPMRYSGGLLGGSWLASLSADLGNGVFDGAWLVENFEGLNPANTWWDKYYHVFANADTEPPRFLEFERWWGGFYLMNREEIEWITRNLFVGNQLWQGGTRNSNGAAFDLRNIKTPIVLFASMGDNITPPQQAFNWVADVYGSTEEIKKRGQTIVGLLHHDIGHLGIFVSGKVAKKEHAQIVEVLESIELLPPGLYGMELTETRGEDGQVTYQVAFHERELEEVTARLNRFSRNDEKPFAAVAQVSELNQRAYELFARPLVQSMSNEQSAELLRKLHPLRLQRWGFSERNPWLSWLPGAATQVKALRAAVPKDQYFRQLEECNSELISAGLDYYRAIRDAVSEALFFQVYGNLLGQVHIADEVLPLADFAPTGELFVQEALEAIEEGGFDEAFARVSALLTKAGDIPLSRLTLTQDLASDYAALLPDLPLDQWRRVRGEQEIIVRNAREEALITLPALVQDIAARERLSKLLDALVTDPRIKERLTLPEQITTLARIKEMLAAPQAASAAPQTQPVQSRRASKPAATADK